MDPMLYCYRTGIGSTVSVAALYEIEARVECPAWEFALPFDGNSDPQAKATIQVRTTIHEAEISRQA